MGFCRGDLFVNPLPTTSPPLYDMPISCKMEPGRQPAEYEACYGARDVDAWRIRRGAGGGNCFNLSTATSV